MDIAEFEQLRQWVLWAAFGVGGLFGLIVQRTHFCTMGAISDAVNIGSWIRVRQWVMAVAVAMAGYHLLGYFGVIDPSQSIYASGHILWLSALLGGAMFGFGMVLASGCGSKTLVRIGAGNLKSVVVFAVMGLAAFATLRGVTAVWRVATVDNIAFDMQGGSHVGAWLGSLAGLAPSEATLGSGLVLSAVMLVWVLKDAEFRSELNNWVAGLGLGLVIVLMWWVSGSMGFVSEHPQTLEAVYVATNTGRMESLTFTAPMAYALDWLIYFSDTNKVLTVSVATVAGVVAGSFLQSRLDGSFRWEGFRDTQDTALHIAGATCMGIGGVTALGCTVGQGLSGLSTMSLTSVLAVVGIVLGALGGFKFQMWLLERE
ncbi:YeeE/YedE family protein [Hydrogenophaga sp. 5NK40-0174]|uniref:YeeE/YedE family protein n=1 Tax=Hydrogenophaga sp. 5NK40-0174 TaxID=3127649 RepID=UPI00310BCC09